MAEDILMPMYRLYIDGKQMDPWVYKHITKVKFEEFKEDGSTSALTIYIEDPEFTVMNANVFIENKTVVQLFIGFSTDFDKVFEGMVGPIEQDYPSSGRITMVVTAKDITYQMTRDSINKGYKGKTYSDIVKEIASKYGLTADVDDTTYIYDADLSSGDIIQQSGKTDLEFIKYLSEEINYTFYVDASARKLIFKKPSNWQSDTEVEVEYKFGLKNLLSFKPKFNDYGKDKNVKVSNIDDATFSAMGAIIGNAGNGLLGNKAVQALSRLANISGDIKDAAGNVTGTVDDLKSQLGDIAGQPNNSLIGNSAGGVKPNVRSVTTQSGDSLYSIAQNQYGDGNKYIDIYNANKDKVTMPGYVIRPGQVLTIP